VTIVTEFPRAGTRQTDITASWITQLRDLEDLLAQTPGLPVDKFGKVTLQLNVTSTADVDEAAALLGVTARWSDPEHYEARREFGPNVECLAFYTTPHGRDEFAAWFSYRNSVEPNVVRRAAA